MSALPGIAGALALGLRTLLAAERPDLVVFLADDHTAADSAVYGSPDFPTPNLLRLAGAGLTFDRAYVASPSCAPSRAALLTGLHPARNGAEANHARPRAEIRKWPAEFRALGYQTVAFGKVGHYRQTTEYGFDIARHVNYHEDVAVPEAAKWLRQRRDKRPLCLLVGTNWPHVPWPAAADGAAAPAVPPHHVDTPETRAGRARYAGAVRRMDDDLGLLLDAVRDTLGPDTFLLHTADHGAQWPFGKWTLYEDGIRTPLVVSWPGRIAPGKRTDALVSWVDILPTLLDAAGAPAPEGLDGRSFLPVLLGKTATHRGEIFTTHSGDGNFNVYPCRSLRAADGWKYILNLHPEFRFTTHVTGGIDNGYWASWVAAATTNTTAAARVNRYEQRPAEELYHLVDDPREQRNLAADPRHAARRQAMRARLEQWMDEQGDRRTVFGQPHLPESPSPRP